MRISVWEYSLIEIENLLAEENGHWNVVAANHFILKIIKST